MRGLHTALRRCALGLGAAWALSSQWLWAAPTPPAQPDSLYFEHHDWELHCDNSRTCRAAGYGDEPPVSVLLTRAAGPNTPVQVAFKIGEYNEDDISPEMRAQMAQHPSAHLWVDGKDLGAMSEVPDDLDAYASHSALNAEQTRALLRAVLGQGQVSLRHGKAAWPLSGRGASAVLLKMDDFQGRVGRPSALARPGNKPESGVRPALPLPQIQAAALPKSSAADLAFGEKHRKALLTAIRAAAPADEEGFCHRLLHAEEYDYAEPPTFSSQRLNDGHMLVSALCWSAAYNWGLGYWVVKDKPPFQPVLVTESGTDSDSGEIAARHKGRGLGDCWSYQDWVWNGQRFQLSSAGSTGECRLIEAGGTWDLPRFRSQVLPPPSP